MIFARTANILSEALRYNIYSQAGISAASSRFIETMVALCPARTPGKAALRNVITCLASAKNNGSRTLESHTCELLFAYEMELDPTVLGYYAQVPCIGVQRLLPNGRRHVSSANLDFLVFRDRSVELVECKQEDWLRAESGKSNADWCHEMGVWRHRPYEQFAHDHELKFRLWSPPRFPGVYLQNLEAIYASIRLPVGEHECRAISRLVAAIRCRPSTLDDVRLAHDGLDARLILWALAQGLIFGPLKSIPFELSHLFTVFPSYEHASLADGEALKNSASIFDQSGPSGALFTCSTTDLKNARLRLGRVEAISRGEAPQTERMRQLANDVEKCREEGLNPLLACLTHFSRSGNRLPRLTSVQEDAVNTVIARSWNKAGARTQRDLFFLLEDECERRGVEPPGRSTFYLRVRRESPSKHALATAGLRGYQAIRPATDPCKRSLHPIAYGHTLHVDSSDFDARMAPDIVKLMPALKSTFYIGVDGATELPMAHSLIFGPARTDGLAILLREYVRRHGRLPQLIHLDRGPENRSGWLREFAEHYNITLRWSPTAASAWNGLAEATIKRVNQAVAHRMIGSTLPDQKGRKSDGRFKSRRNAKLGFDVVHEQFLEYVYKDLPETPCADGRSPLEKKEACILLAGDLGFACSEDEDFLLSTSIEAKLKRNVNLRRGIRTEEGYFSSDELIAELRLGKIEQSKSDCEDPTTLRVRINGRWIKAFHSSIQSAALLSAEDKRFNLLYQPTQRAISRKRKNQINRHTFNRIENANLAANLPRVEREDMGPPASDMDARTLSDNPGGAGTGWDDIRGWNERGEAS